MKKLMAIAIVLMVYAISLVVSPESASGEKEAIHAGHSNYVSHERVVADFYNQRQLSIPKWDWEK